MNFYAEKRLLLTEKYSPYYHSRHFSHDESGHQVNGEATENSWHHVTDSTDKH